MGLALSQNCSQSSIQQSPKFDLLPRYSCSENYLNRPYYFKNKNEEIKNKLIEKEIWNNSFKSNGEQINSTFNFISLLNEKDTVEQIKKLKETTSLDLDNLSVIHQNNNYLIKIPIKELDNVFIELIV